MVIVAATFRLRHLPVPAWAGTGTIIEGNKKGDDGQ